MNREERKERIVKHVEEILYKNIIPFWLKYSVDKDCGGFYGFISDDNDISDEGEKGLVMTSRILWTFSTLYRKNPEDLYKEMADHALGFLQNNLKDMKNGGYYWSCEACGEKSLGQKVIYGEAFALYGLCEYYKNWPSAEIENDIHRLFALLEKNARDREFNGYWEACREDWTPYERYCLSKEDRPCSKSMNTHLHVLEAYTQYLKLFRGSDLAKGADEAVKSLIEIHLERIVDSASGHLTLFFDKNWERNDSIRSYGHDIEASWLLWEAMEILNEKDFTAKYRDKILSLFNASLEGLRTVDDTGQSYMIHESEGDHFDLKRMWWVQAETLVGLVNGWELSGDESFLEKAESVLSYITEQQLNPNGEWYWSLDDDNRPMEGFPKGGFWKTPYHNSRASLELLRRLKS